MDKILNHDLFLGGLEENREAEADRIFCRHDMAHSLDVARIARILNAEEAYGIPADFIYAAALLHDIGRHRQYSEEISHEKASAETAARILAECGFDEAEKETIVKAILRHRDRRVKNERNLCGLLYRADKASRACYACEAVKECNWPDTKKNLKIRY